MEWFWCYVSRSRRIIDSIFWKTWRYHRGAQQNNRATSLRRSRDLHTAHYTTILTPLRDRLDASFLSNHAQYALIKTDDSTRLPGLAPIHSIVALTVLRNIRTSVGVRAVQSSGSCKASDLYLKNSSSSGKHALSGPEHE